MFLGLTNYIGICEIVIILGLLVAIVIGFLFGFFRTLLKIGSIISGFLFSVCLAYPFSKLLYMIFGTPVYNKFYHKVEASDKWQSLNGTEDAREALAQVLKESGVPFSEFISKRVDLSNVEDLKIAIADKISYLITSIIFVIIAFFVLLIGTSIILFILRKCLEKFRENKLFRFIDGILGVVASVAISLVVVMLVFFVFTLIGKDGSFYSWLSNDIRLESSSGFGLGRYLYDHNLLKGLWDLVF